MTNDSHLYLILCVFLLTHDLCMLYVAVSPYLVFYLHVLQLIHPTVELYSGGSFDYYNWCCQNTGCEPSTYTYAVLLYICFAVKSLGHGPQLALGHTRSSRPECHTIFLV